MKTSNHVPLISNTGLTEKTSFRIDANNAKLFDILQNSMYTDKILAPVREIICNAYDAHQQTKNEAPFLVFVPNSNVREWVVRDYGPGLSHDDIMGLYTTYMQSTKDTSDDMIGGFGIGSKSPLAYTDQFTVISYFNHKKTRYAVFIGGDGLPTISVVDQIDTLEGNGLEVRIPVLEKDIYHFETGTRNVLRWFPSSSYALHGTTVTPVTYTYENAQYAIRDTLHTHPVVLMGNVAYEISNNALATINLDSQYEITTETLSGIVLKANIGECSVSPSREQISADSKTKQWLKDRIERIAADQSKTYVDDMAAAPNPMAALRIHAEHINNRKNRFVVFKPWFGGAFFPRRNMNFTKALNIHHEWFTSRDIAFYSMSSRTSNLNISPRRFTTADDYTVPAYAVPCVIDAKTPRVRALEAVRGELERRCAEGRSKHRVSYGYRTTNADPHVMLMPYEVAEKFFKDEYIDLRNVVPKAQKAKSPGIAKGWDASKSFGPMQPLPDTFGKESYGLVVPDASTAKKIIDTIPRRLCSDWTLGNPLDLWVIHSAPKKAVAALTYKSVNGWYAYILTQLNSPELVDNILRRNLHNHAHFYHVRTAVKYGFFKPAEALDWNKNGDSQAAAYVYDVRNLIYTLSVGSLLSAPNLQAVQDRSAELKKMMEANQHPVYEEFERWAKDNPAQARFCLQMIRANTPDIDPAILAAIKEKVQ